MSLDIKFRKTLVALAVCALILAVLALAITESVVLAGILLVLSIVFALAAIALAINVTWQRRKLIARIRQDGI